MQANEFAHKFNITYAILSPSLSVLFVHSFPSFCFYRLNRFACARIFKTRKIRKISAHFSFLIAFVLIADYTTPICSSVYIAIRIYNPYMHSYVAEKEVATARIVDNIYVCLHARMQFFSRVCVCVWLFTSVFVLCFCYMLHLWCCTFL